MATDLSILKMASAMAQHAALRHRVISENLANADTPGFKARDIPTFDPKQALRDTRRAETAAGRFSPLSQRLTPFEVQNLEASPNGNTVKIDAQMVKAADAQAQHEAAMTIYRKSLDLLRLSYRTGAR